MTIDAQGKVTRVSGVTIDITDLKEAEARRTLLVREVDHRARNALALVQSIVRLTKSTRSTAMSQSIEGRIRALSTAHALLSESRWEGADLGRLVDEELAPYRQGEAERIALSGPAVFLQPASAQILALVLHELATNAAKYGAMSLPVGPCPGHLEAVRKRTDADLGRDRTGRPFRPRRRRAMAPRSSMRASCNSSAAQ